MNLDMMKPVGPRFIEASADLSAYGLDKSRPYVHLYPEQSGKIHDRQRRVQLTGTYTSGI